MLRRRLALAGALVAVALGAFFLVTLLSGDDAPERPRAGAAPTPQPGGPGGTGTEDGVTPAVRARVAELEPAEQLAQVFMVGFTGRDAAAAISAARPWGALVVGPENTGAGGVPSGLARAARAAARRADAPPPLVVAAQLSGFPEQPRLRRPAPARAAAREAGEELAGAGVDAVLAPTADLAVPAGPEDDRGFSDDPTEVALLARAAVDGWLAGGVLPMVGHFPGQGAASQDPLDGPSIVGADPEIDAFRPALERAPAVVMSNAAYVVYDAVTPAGLLPAAVAQLRRETRFRGLVVSDDLAGAAAATGGTIGAAAVEALRAGVDLVQVRDPAERDAAYREALAALEAGDLPPERVAEAATRVLALKDRAGRL